MDEERRLAKNKLISLRKKETLLRHENMVTKTYEVKIQENKLRKRQREDIERIFLEAKWYKNYILNWMNESKDNKLSKFNTKITQITKKDKDMNDVQVEIKRLPAQSRQCLVSRMVANLRAMAALRKKGLQKLGKLKFSKEETAIDYKQIGNSHKIINKKRIRLQGIKGELLVNGLEQFYNIPGVEVANARLLHRATGYFVQFVCFLPKAYSQETPEAEKKIVGVDFGCQTAFTLSMGEKITASVPESERLKKLQRDFSRKQKGSKNRERAGLKVRKEYQKITNRKNDMANKIVYNMTKNSIVVIQDEQLKAWQSGNHSKAVQYSVLGRVKAKLKLHNNVVILPKNYPTTKLCTNCGKWHDELKLWNRTFKCKCGVEEDRDIHAAQNMVWLYEHIYVGAEHTKLKRVEMESLVKGIINSGDQTLSAKHEAAIP